jgi:copper(I)-binding protein
MYMMKRRSVLAMIAGGVALIARVAPGFAHGDEGTPSAGSTPGAPVGSGTAMVSLTISNTGASDDRLVSASADVAGHVELHAMTTTNGVMEMSPMPDGLPIPAVQTVALSLSGDHLMLVGLRRDLLAGQTYQLTLRFEQAGEIEITVPVFASERAFEDADQVDPVMVGDLRIAGIWTRNAPALLGTPATPAH